MAPVVLPLLQTRWQVMNEERTGFWLRQTEHSYGHLWHRYSVTVNQVMMSILKQLIFYCLSNLQITTGVSQLTVYFCYLLNTKYKDWNTSWKVTSHVHVRITLCTVYNRTVFKNGSCCTVRPTRGRQLTLILLIWSKTDMLMIILLTILQRTEWFENATQQN